MSELQDLIKKAREIEEKNTKYEYNRNRLDSIIPKIQEHIREIDILLAELNPTVKINIGKRYKVDYDEIITWITDKTASGNEVRTKDIHAAFPNLEDNAMIMLMAKLNKVNALKKRKEGNRVVYFQ